MTTPLDCEKLVGRKRDICRGHDDDGNPINIPEQKRQAYIRRWANQPNGKVSYTNREWQGNSPCRHLGEVLRTVKCKPCQGTDTAQIRACAVHGECTWKSGIRSRGMGGTVVESCKFCDDYEPPNGENDD